MQNKLWVYDEKKNEKQSVLWNIVSSGLNSVVSIFLLLMVTRINGVENAGVFSLAFSTSQLMLTIGNYGMRNYQVTDIKCKYSLYDYFSSRVITNIAMMIAVLGFVVVEKYYFEKAVITLLLCTLKITDAEDDVYGGYYQQHGRLDISGKMMSIRIVVYVSTFLAFDLISGNLLFSVIAAVAAASIVLIILLRSVAKVVPVNEKQIGKLKIRLLLQECFPLCMSAFLLMYLNNAAKYAIDIYLTNTEQAYYTYLFMPCFVINLFVGFALQPLLVRISILWGEKEYNKFLRLIILIFLVALGISAIIITGGALVGTQILSVVFGMQLNQYRLTLVILLFGGAFFSFAVIAQILLTIMRKQTFLLYAFIIVSILAYFISNVLVSREGLLGAGLAYMIIAGTLFMLLLVLIIIFFYREKNKVENI